MSDTTIKTVKVREASVANLAKANSGNASAKRKLDKTGDTCWAQTLLIIDNHKPLVEFDDTQDEKDIKDAVRDAFKSAFMEEVEAGTYEVPEKGVNARNGDTISVLNGKTGEIKWSSWDVTRNSVSICGEIGQLIKAGIADQLIVGENEVLAKASAKACKPKQPAFTTIENATILITGKFDELKPEEHELALSLIEKLYTDLADKVANPVAKAA